MKMMSGKRMGIIAGLLAAVVLIIAVVVAGFQNRAKAAAIIEEKMAMQHSARPVVLEEVQLLDVAREQSYPGLVQASEEFALSFRVGGPLLKVNIKQGEFVPAGEVLMQIDPRDFEDAIQALDAQLAGALAVLQSTQSDYGRTKQLFDEKVIPQSDFDHAKGAFDVAAASVKTLKATLDIARHRLGDTTLQAPCGGTVTRQLVEQYEMVSPGQVVVKFHNIQSLEVVVNVPENVIARYRGTSRDIWGWVTFPALLEKKYKAKLTEWSSEADPITRTYAVTLGLDAPQDLRVLPGMSAEVVWADDQAPARRFTVPVSALVSDDAGNSCLWVYNSETGKAERRVVQTGPMMGTSRIVVSDGLAPGEQVVVSGSRLIHEGMLLKKAGTSRKATP